MSRRPNADWNFAPAVRRLLQDDGRHPAPHWCHKCGKLGCFDHHGLSYGGPTATPRPARDTGTIARRRRVLDALARIGRAA